MLRKFSGIILLINCLIYNLQGQSNYDIQLVLNNVDCNSNTICYDVQLRSSDNTTWGLAGQNYRLYYDASLATYQSGSSFLGVDYQDFTLVQHVQNQNAMGTGSLPFEDNFSFLNYSIDLSNTTDGGALLPADGSWLTTSQICFSVSSYLLIDTNTCFEAVWARMGSTESYATSFVEISEWVAMSNTQMAVGLSYHDLDTSSNNCFTGVCSYDFGDLPDTSAFTSRNNYQTLVAHNGPIHAIKPGLKLGINIDGETIGQTSNDALGDGIDEDGLTMLQSLDIYPSSTFRLPLNYTNITGDTVHLEAWIDWNGDGDFEDSDELIFDVVDPDQGLYNRIEATVPVSALTGLFLGFRIRISNEDNMTPYGFISSGEVEDYLIKVKDTLKICLPTQAIVLRGKK